MPEFFTLVDARGRPIEKKLLTEEVANATVTGVRSPITGYPGDGLNPLRLAAILREADAGDPVRQLELAETVEERDPHILGVLGTRKRSVSQLEITVEDGSPDPAHKKQAERIRDWLKRDELQGELFDILDGIHKGYSFTEIIWDTSNGQWQPNRLEWRDPRWFDFDRTDFRTPQLIELGGQQRVPLPGGKFIYAPMKAKSGLPMRSGLSRVLAWLWMFKAFAGRDWAIFTQGYGQPIRVGKYGQGATQKDKDSLFRAIANVAGDMAAMIPESMKMEFVESKSIGASSDLYEKRVTHLDLQASKAVLGQTTTTDAVSGGHAVSQEHRQVQEDIETADARELAAHINRDLVRVWIDLEFGPQTHYPRIRIGRPDAKDVKMITEAVSSLRLPVKRSEMYELIGVSEPEAGDDVIVPGDAPAASAEPPLPGERRPRLPGDARPAAETTLHAETEDPGEREALAADRRQDRLADDTAGLTSAAGDAMLEVLAAMVQDPAVRDLEDLRSRLLAMAPTISAKAMATALRQALVVAELTGRADLLDA